MWLKKIKLNNTPQQSKTCILYFTKGKLGIKAFSSSKRKSNAVQRLLFEKTLSEIRKSKLDYWISNGAAFGDAILERLNGAVAHVFDLGFENVIVVGDDAPELSVKQIKQAYQSLESGKVSIGPAKDGGTYLIAFNKYDFRKGILENLTWHRPSFKQELLLNLSTAKLSYELLTPLEDLDNTSDLAVFLSKISINPLQKVLKSLFLISEKREITSFLYTSKLFESALDRGPPQMI